MKKTLLLLIALIIVFFIAMLLLQNDRRDPSRKMIGDLVRTQTKIAILEINGPIFDSRQYIKELEELVNNPWVAAVILRINSPGGAVGTSQELFNTIISQKQKKPIITSIENVGTSGAYYLALATDKIYANPGAITGSIGVIMEFYNTSELWDKIGISFQVLKSGEYKDIGSPIRDMTDEERKMLEESLEDVYAQFLNDIKQQRGDIILEKMNTNKEFEDLEEYLYYIADGKIYTGQQALEIGLIDELGGLYDAAEYLQHKLNLPKKPDFVRPRRKRFPFLGIISEIHHILDIYSHSGAKVLYLCPVSR